MTEHEKLREELLKQNGMVSGRISLAERERICQMLARDQARVRRMKWATIIAWLLPALSLIVVVAIIGASGASDGDTIVGGIMIILFFATPCIAIIFTVFYFIRSRSLNSRQIHAKLADIEEQLKRISQNQEAKPPQ